MDKKAADEDLQNLSDDDLKSLLKELCCKLEKSSEEKESAVPGKTLERQRKEEIMDLLHEYNDIKDATQIVLGALAAREGVMLKQLHLDYNLPLHE